MTGTWCTNELQRAVKLGYRIMKIHEVWHFPEDQRQDGLFTDYVNKWLKNKQEATGLPKGCVTEDQKAAYIPAYEEREGIKLENVEKNPRWKAVAKLMLNRYEKIILIQLMKRYRGILIRQFFIFCFWGKSGEEENKPSTKTIQRPSDLYRLINNDTIEIRDVRIFSEDVMEV